MRALLGSALAVVLCAAMTGCGAGRADRPPNELVYWTIFDTQDKMSQQQPMIDRFVRETGISVRMVGVSQDKQAQAMVTAAASGDLPDVILHAVDSTPGWARQGLLDPAAAQSIVDDLGTETFNERALRFATVDGGLGAVPSDGWGELLYYRKDLFERAGLRPPRTFDDVGAAAKRLHRGQTIGLAGGTKAGNIFTMQTLEAVALANGCQLTDPTGTEIRLDRPECERAVAWYADVMSRYSAGGEQDTESSRATYLAGRAAMTFWSPHLLDELTGADEKFPPSCARCEADPLFLARNTGVVALIEGPDAADPAQFGQTLNLGISATANTRAATEFVRWTMSDGYLDFLSVNPEGRFPMRTGPADAPGSYVERWATLPMGYRESGVPPVGEAYGADVVDTIREGADGFARWGLGTDAAVLEATLYGELPLTNDLRGALDGVPANDTVRQMADRAATMQGRLR